MRTSAIEMLECVPDGASIVVGGFGVTGVPYDLIDALCELGRKELHIISNNAGIAQAGEQRGLGKLVVQGRVRKFTGSFPSFVPFHEQFMRGEAEIELVPQGTLAERLRAGGYGIPAFYTPTAAGTILQTGEYASRLDANGQPLEYLPVKEVREWNGKPCVLETALQPDFALVKANRGDRYGNLDFRRSARNFNPVAAKAGTVTFAEVRYLVERGDIDPDDVDVPGVFVDHVYHSSEGPLDVR
ncbi:CoA transferase subunit A [Streptomyces brasiliensis]|uniref:CoA transferase subunit A n=1 Tax=Streptomyces brasiliensis TaxID=1954 RepID=UPI00166F9961|nr:3-oxoacid CoA-transferase subunit A [Streptomyces brasiliensis]